ncbi:hypothetical protein, partial [Pseudomonas khavaziana]|uniref:hypothetical protein n=1 Tax=Pseudomonas khavaziana TaxID=2842351 RepID=UPI001C3D1EC8
MSSKKSDMTDYVRSLLETEGVSLELPGSVLGAPREEITVRGLLDALQLTAPNTTEAASQRPDTMEIRTGAESVLVNTAVLKTLVNNITDLPFGQVLPSGAVLLNAEGRQALLSALEDSP